MNPVAAEEIVKAVRRRVSEGDCPITPRQPVETLEDTLIEIADQRDRAYSTFASGLKKLAPDLFEQIALRWAAHKEREDAALDDFLKFLRS